MPWNPENYNVKKKEVIKILEENKITNVMKSEYKIIYTKEFYCDGHEDEYDQHPRVYYKFNNKVDSTDKTDKGYVVCEYCYQKFKYEDNTDSVNSILKGSG
jgi:uncharacterized Zn-finger protein